jgi:hypothetical protein
MPHEVYIFYANFDDFQDIVYVALTIFGGFVYQLCMRLKLSFQIYTGRPFGGVGLLWRRTLADCVQIIDRDDDGRCLVTSLDIDDRNIKLICDHLRLFELL